MNKFIDVNVLKQQDFQDFSNTDVWYAIDHCPTVNAVPIPCKIGDIVFGIRNYRGKTHIQKGFVTDMFFTQNMKLMIVVKHICRGQWGEKVFETYEEAEMALKKVIQNSTGKKL